MPSLPDVVGVKQRHPLLAGTANACFAGRRRACVLLRHKLDVERRPMGIAPGIDDLDRAVA